MTKTNWFTIDEVAAAAGKTRQEVVAAIGIGVLRLSEGWFIENNQNLALFIQGTPPKHKLKIYGAENLGMHYKRYIYHKTVAHYHVGITRTRDGIVDVFVAGSKDEAIAKAREFAASHTEKMLTSPAGTIDKGAPGTYSFSYKELCMLYSLVPPAGNTKLLSEKINNYIKRSENKRRKNERANIVDGGATVSLFLSGNGKEEG